MLKSLFESSIDKLHIPSDMKDAIKKINNICLEAEGDEKDLGYTPINPFPNQSLVPKDPGYTPVPKEEYDAQQAQAGNNAGTQVAQNNAQKAEAKPAQPAQNSGEQPAQNAETKTPEQPAQTTGAQPAQNAEGQQAQAADGKAAEQTAAQPQKPQYRRGADVATVQYFLQSRMPDEKIVADGILGPKTIKAIQKKEAIEETGKMNSKTQESFKLLLDEAKKKVIPIQQQLGVTADGLIGKQTMAAMNKANMDVASVFSKNGPQQVASNKSNVNVLDTPFNEEEAKKQLDGKKITSLEYRIWRDYGISPEHQRKNPNEVDAQVVRIDQKNNQKKVDVLDTPFDAAKADKELANKQITQAEYNTWKGFGISPEHQRTNPKETKAECIRLGHLTPSERQQEMQERLAKNDPKTGAQSKQTQPTGADKFKPQNEDEQNFYDKTLKEYINVYKKMGSDDKAAAKQAERVAQNHLYHYRKGTLPKAQTPEAQKPAVGAGNDSNVAQVAANVKPPQNDAEKKFFNQTKENWTKVYAEKFKNNPERIVPAADQQARIELMKYRARMAQAARQNGQQQQQVASQGNAQPAQKAAPKQKQQQQGTQYYSGKVSYINLPPDEKKVYDEAEKKSLDKNMKWGKNEQIALDQAALDASAAVLKYRAQKG